MKGCCGLRTWTVRSEKAKEYFSFWRDEEAKRCCWLVKHVKRIQGRFIKKNFSLKSMYSNSKPRHFSSRVFWKCNLYGTNFLYWYQYLHNLPPDPHRPPTHQLLHSQEVNCNKFEMLIAMIRQGYRILSCMGRCWFNPARSARNFLAPHLKLARGSVNFSLLYLTN